MMKKPFLKQGLPLLALAIALAGCPALDTVSGPGPVPTPTPTPTPSGDPTDDPSDDPSDDPGVALKTLGPVNVTLESAFEVEHGPVIVRLSRQGDSIRELGLLGTLGTTKPEPDDPYTYSTLSDKIDPPYYMFEPANITHYFQWVNSETLILNGDLTIRVGQTSPSAIRSTPYHLELEFPTSTQGDLTATPKDGSLLFETKQPGGDQQRYSFEAIRTVPKHEVPGTRSATASVTVSVTELDGTPSRNLAPTNFQLSGDGRITYRATEIAPGRYRLVMALDELGGPFRKPQQRTLTVSHTPLTYTHTEETN
jgi:hypothetical protein